LITTNLSHSLQPMDFDIITCQYLILTEITYILALKVKYFN